MEEDGSVPSDAEPFVVEEGLEVDEPIASSEAVGSALSEIDEEFLTAEEDGEVIEITEEEEFAYANEGYLPPDVGREDVIDDTVVSCPAVEDDKENGPGVAPQDFQDEEAEPVVEVTRRRLSHEGICYCGKDRNLNIAELLCASCHRWYHESCIGYQLGKLVPFMMNYVFICKNCSATGLETFKRSPATYVQICVTAIANLQQASAKEGSNNLRFSKARDIFPFIDMHWEGITPTRRVSWHTAITRTLFKETTLFTLGPESDVANYPSFGLLALDLTQIRPNYEAMITSGLLKLGDYTSGALRRTGTKRRTVDGSSIFAQSQAAVAKKTKGDSFVPKAFGLGFGYPTEHPFNKDGYRYILAEPDPNAPFRQEFDESSDWAGKPIPGFLYRVLIPPYVFLALHDRAPQLKVSEDKLSVTGEKGYCMIRASHYVTKGSWYWEAKVIDLPDNAACRLGWGQCYANLQAPLGFDKFGYCWRSRLGTKFHQAIGRSYCPGGYGVGDVLGFLIILPDQKRRSKNGPPSVPESFKDKPLVRFKSHLYYEDKDVSAEVEVSEVREGSKMVCFKNGVCVGVAYEELFEGAYYPSISLFKAATVKANFGPTFHYPPPQEFECQAFQHRAEEAIAEQTMADILFLTENDGKLSLENSVAVPN